MTYSRGFVTVLAAVVLCGTADAQSGVYQPGLHTLFYLPLDGPNAGAAEGCSINNSALLSYIPDRFNNGAKAIHVNATASASDSFNIVCGNTKIAGNTTGNITIGYWLRSTLSIPAGGNCGVPTGACSYRNLTILASNTDNGGCRKYAVTQVSNGSSPGAYPIACSAGDGDLPALSMTSIADGTWHNIVWVFDYTNHMKTLYLDGVQNLSRSLPGPPPAAMNTQYIAGAENGSFALNGDMDDFWIEDHAWGQPEVTTYFGNSLSTGTITVTTNLSAATFTITGPATYTGTGASFTEVAAPTGAYTITFGNVAGYITPPSQTDTLNANGTLALSGVYQTCAVHSVTLEQNNSNRTISASDSPVNGSPCAWNFTITNRQSNLWLDLHETTTGSAKVVPADPISALYAKYGIIAPGKSLTFRVQFFEPGQDVNIFANLTGGALDTAMNMNVIQALIDAASLDSVAGTIALSIEDVGEINQALSQMPHFERALADFFHLACFSSFCIFEPKIADVFQQLIEFTQSSAEVQSFVSLIMQLGVDVIETTLTALLHLPGAVAAVLLEVAGNVWTAFFGNTAGSVSLTAH